MKHRTIIVKTPVLFTSVPLMCVYKISFPVNGFFYIGCTKDLKRRINEHINSMIKEENSDFMTHAFRSPTKVVVEVLEVVTDVDLLVNCESSYIYKNRNNTSCLNREKCSKEKKRLYQVFSR